MTVYQDNARVFATQVDTEYERMVRATIRVNNRLLSQHDRPRDARVGIAVGSLVDLVSRDMARWSTPQPTERAAWARYYTSLNRHLTGGVS